MAVRVEIIGGHRISVASPLAGGLVDVLGTADALAMDRALRALAHGDALQRGQGDEDLGAFWAGVVNGCGEPDGAVQLPAEPPAGVRGHEFGRGHVPVPQPVQLVRGHWANDAGDNPDGFRDDDRPHLHNPQGWRWWLRWGRV